MSFMFTRLPKNSFWRSKMWKQRLESFNTFGWFASNNNTCVLVRKCWSANLSKYWNLPGFGYINAEKDFFDFGIPWLVFSEFEKICFFRIWDKIIFSELRQTIQTEFFPNMRQMRIRFLPNLWQMGCFPNFETKRNIFRIRNKLDFSTFETNGISSELETNWFLLA